MSYFNYEIVGNIDNLENIAIIEKGLLDHISSKPGAYAVANNSAGTAHNLTESFSKRVEVYFTPDLHSLDNFDNVQAVLLFNAIAVVNGRKIDFSDFTYAHRIAFCMQCDSSIKYSDLVYACVQSFLTAEEARTAFKNDLGIDVTVHDINFEDAKKQFLKPILIDNPDFEINRIESALDIIDAEKRIVLKSHTGTGKTQVVINPLVEEAIKQGKKVAYITNRKSILDAVQIDGITDYRDVTPGTTIQNLKVCINSLFKPALAEFAKSADLVVIDEVEQVVRQMLTGDMNNRRQQVFEAFTQVAKNAGQLIACDADANCGTAKFLDAKTVVLKTDTYCDIRATISNGNNSFKSIVSEVKTKQVIVATDSKRHANMLSEKIKSEYPGKKIMLITSDTVAGDEQKSFIANINREIDSYNAIIYTPAMSSGVSIQQGAANRKNYGIFTGNIVPSDIIQMIRRDRTTSQIEIGIIHKPNFKGPVKSRRDSALEIMVDDLNKVECVLKNSVRAALVHTMSHLGFNVSVTQELTTAEAKETVSDATKLENEAYIEGVLSAEAADKTIVSAAVEAQQIDINTAFAVERYKVERFFETKSIDRAHLEDWKRGKLKILVDFNRMLLTADADELRQYCHDRNKSRASNELDLSYDLYVLIHKVLDAAQIDIVEQTSRVDEAKAAFALEVALASSWNNLGLKRITNRMIKSTQKIKTLNSLLVCVLGYGLKRKQKMVNGNRTNIYVFDRPKADLVMKYVK